MNFDISLYSIVKKFITLNLKIKGDDYRRLSLEFAYPVVIYLLMNQRPCFLREKKPHRDFERNERNNFSFIKIPVAS